MSKRTGARRCLPEPTVLAVESIFFEPVRTRQITQPHRALAKLMREAGPISVRLTMIVYIIGLSLVVSLLGCGGETSINPRAADPNPTSADSRLENPESSPEATDPDAVVCWGDSMTAGNEGVIDPGKYPAILEQEIGHDVINEGVGGQTSTQIGVRQGGIPTYAIVDGGVIPASGGVIVRFKRGYEPHTSPNGSILGSILGVKGAVSLMLTGPGGRFTFTRETSGVPVPATGTPQFIPDNPYATYRSVFWEGRNNLFRTSAGPWGPDQILADLRRK